MTPKILYQIPNSAGTSFMPSNGTEGEIFESAFCSNCIHEKFYHTQKHGDKQCEVFNRVFLNAPDPQPEWVFNEEGWPICKDWIKWDWSKDDDDNWNDPVLPDPIDPSQLSLFPLYPDEVDFNKTEIKIFEKAKS
jgi:hypothetical protein